MIYRLVVVDDFHEIHIADMDHHVYHIMTQDCQQ